MNRIAAALVPATSSVDASTRVREGPMRQLTAVAGVGGLGMMSSVALFLCRASSVDLEQRIALFLCGLLLFVAGGTGYAVAAGRDR